MTLRLLINVYMYQRLVQGGAENQPMEYNRFVTLDRARGLFDLHVKWQCKCSFSKIVALSMTTFDALGRSKSHNHIYDMVVFISPGSAQ